MEECYFYFLNVTLLHGCFSRFLNCANANKSRNASQIVYYNKMNTYKPLHTTISKKDFPRIERKLGL